ncbi:MAG: TolC family protein [Verrucomicrobia bacterium]|nr:MAG: TolC family protein [Verrucomicrobiota bacterium]
MDCRGASRRNQNRVIARQTHNRYRPPADLLNMKVQGSSFRARGLALNVECSMLNVECSMFRLHCAAAVPGLKHFCSNFSAQDPGFGVQDSRFKVQGSRFELNGFVPRPLSHSPVYPLSRSLLLLASTALLLCGCARYQSRPLSPTATATQLESRSLTNLALKPVLQATLHKSFTAWPPESWDLDMLTAAAFYYQPTLEVVRAQWDVARGGEVTAAQRPNPTLTVAPGYAYPTTAATPWTPLVMLDVPLETAGKRRYRRAQAAHLSDAARLNILSAAWQVRDHVVTSVIDYEATQKRQALLQRQIALQEDLLHRLDQQIQAGALAPSDTLSFRIALDKARLDLADAQRQSAETRARMAEAIGIPTDALQHVKLAPANLPNEATISALTSAEFRRMALLSRADILSSLSEYAASESALQLEIAKQYPDVHLQPQYQYDQGDSKWSVGVVVDLPVLNQNEGPIAEAKARRAQAAAKFNALQAGVLAEIDRAVAVFHATQKTLSDLHALADSQAKRVASTEAMVKEGASDQLDLLNVQIEAASTELLQLDARIKLQQAIAALENTLQHDLNFPDTLFQSTQTDLKK